MPLQNLNITKTTNGWLIQPRFGRANNDLYSTDGFYVDDAIHVNRNDLAFVFSSSAEMIEWLIPTVTEEGRNLFPRTNEGATPNV